MKKVNSFLILIMFGFVMMAQNTHAGDVNAAPDLTQDAPGIQHNARIAIAPYAQVVANDSYTFIGISHPSLTTAAARIGVAVEVVGMTGTVNTQPGRSAVFTVKGGETHRVFIVNQGHASINTSNAAFTDSRTHIIPVVDTPQFGAVRVSTVHKLPTLLTTAGTLFTSIDSLGTGVTTCNSYANMRANPGCGYANLNQLSMWGIVYSEAAGTGFAMEFIGDMQDSTIQTGLNRSDLKLGNRGRATIQPLSTHGYLESPTYDIHLAPHRPGAGVN